MFLAVFLSTWNPLHWFVLTDCLTDIDLLLQSISCSFWLKLSIHKHENVVLSERPFGHKISEKHIVTAPVLCTTSQDIIGLQKGRSDVTTCEIWLYVSKKWRISSLIIVLYAYWWTSCVLVNCYNSNKQVQTLECSSCTAGSSPLFDGSSTCVCHPGYSVQKDEGVCESRENLIKKQIHEQNGTKFLCTQ